MKKIVLNLAVLSLIAIGDVAAQELIHYWNFNTNTNITTLLTPNTSVVSGASISHVAGGTSLVDVANGTGQNFNVTNPNARNSDASGTHLRFNNPIGGQLVFALPTTGYVDPVVKFATRRSGSGAGNQYWDYTINGTTYIPFDTLNPQDADPVMEMLDFSAIAGADNNPNFKIRVSFDAGTTGGTGGNNRFDNFTVDAYPVPTLVHYWNFNNTTNQTTLLTATMSLVSGSSISHVAGGISLIDVTGGTGQNYNVENLNARNSDASGTHLRFNDPIGGQLVFALPTTGYKDAVVKFVTRRSGSGAGLQYWEYSVNGTTYVPLDTIIVTDVNPVLETLDLRSIPATDNNANLKLRVSFAAGAGGSGGNNRFDNFTLDANSTGGPDVTAPMVTLIPADAAVNIATSINPTISFNEAIRLINNSPVTNTNVASLVELRLNNATGTVVPFTATILGNTITVAPTTAFANNQQYYLALKANMVEDNSDNAVAAVQSATFKTIMLQTPFAAGDMAFVAYRMNATNTDDEIALLTFVDILPGTFINLTDGKYTSNAQPQCAGGIVWTAPLNQCVPAGTVITIKTEAMTANKGTVTGAGFGLSSGGDQVMVYTGTAANPNYITALTANAWATANTSCSGSLSLKPAALTDGVNAANLSTAPGNVSGLSVNAYYNGTQAGSASALRTAINNPANWLSVGAGTAPQTWPAYSFPAPPDVTSATMTSSNTIRLIFSADLNTASATNVNNYTGIVSLVSATVTSNGAAIDTVTLTFSAPFTNGNTYNLQVANITNAANVPMACPFNFSLVYRTQIAFASNFVVVGENAGTTNVQLNVTNPGAGSLTLEVMGAPYSTASAADYVLSSQAITLTGTTTAVNIPVTIIDDNIKEQAAEYITLKIKNPSGVVINGDTTMTLYIRDNDQAVPTTATGEIELKYLGSFDPSGSNSSTCEVVAYDSASKRLFTTSAIAGFLDVIDFSDPKALKTIKSIDMNPYGGVTSVAVKNGVVAVASPNAVEQLNGSVVFFDKDGNFLKQLQVGALPDMITFTPDGSKVLTANEGQPNVDYTVDPEGTVSIIDMTAGAANLSQTDVTTVDFTALNAIEGVYLAKGIRKLKTTSTLSQDFEPEYITVSSNSETAWVTIQENNAIAEIDLRSKTLTDVWAMGMKDYSLPGNGLDASDNNNQIVIANWPVKAFFIPDAMATYKVNGTNYLITANEGDEKEYNGLNERTTVGAASYVLDPATFPNAAELKKNHNLGRMRVTNLSGDKDKDGDMDEIHCVGTRSFSIWNADTKSLVYDSGDDFEVFIANTPSIAPLFNSDHEDNSLKSRSRSKGPEPEGVATAQISGKQYAFVSLERVGGVMVYNVTDPANAKFVDYKNSRSVSAYTGDHGPETMVYIPATTKNAPAHLIVANEISGTLTVFEVVDNNPNNIIDPSFRRNTFNVFPNPSKHNNIVYFNRVADVQVTDISGKIIFKGNDVLTLDVSTYVPGVYTINTADGETARMVISE